MERPDWSGRCATGAEAGKRRLLVLGLGNDILCDDAVGLIVVREIRKRLAAISGVEHIDVRETCEMGLSLLDYIMGYDELVLVDSIQTGRAPAGHVHELEAKEIKMLPVTTPHFLGVGEMIALGRQLGLAVPGRVRIFAIEVEDPFTITTEMTPALRAAMPGIIERVWGALTV